jgi:hypothetical protein
VVEVTMPFLATFLLAAALGAPSPVPDVFFEQTARTTVDGKAGAVTRSRVYWRGQKVRLESGTPLRPLVVLLDLALDRGLQLDARTKTATVIDMAALHAESGLGFAMAGDAMGVDEPDSLRTVPIPGRRVIAGRACEGHRIRGRGVQIDVWVSRELPLPMAMFAELLEWSGAAQALGGLLPEIEKLPGFPLQTASRLTIGGRTYETRGTITRITVGPLSPALFDVPAGYRTLLAPSEPVEP